MSVLGFLFTTSNERFVQMDEQNGANTLCDCATRINRLAFVSLCEPGEA